jgi:hypothetical protein
VKAAAWFIIAACLIAVGLPIASLGAIAWSYVEASS